MRSTFSDNDASEPIRAMPRAYERIVNILNRLEDVRKSIEQLSLTLKQASLLPYYPCFLLIV